MARAPRPRANATRSRTPSAPTKASAARAPRRARGSDRRRCAPRACACRRRAVGRDVAQVVDDQQRGRGSRRPRRPPATRARGARRARRSCPPSPPDRRTRTRTAHRTRSSRTASARPCRTSRRRWRRRRRRAAPSPRPRRARGRRARPRRSETSAARFTARGGAASPDATSRTGAARTVVGPAHAVAVVVGVVGPDLEGERDDERRADAPPRDPPSPAAPAVPTSHRHDGGRQRAGRGRPPSHGSGSRPAGGTGRRRGWRFSRNESRMPSCASSLR